LTKSLYTSLSTFSKYTKYISIFKDNSSENIIASQLNLLEVGNLDASQVLSREFIRYVVSSFQKFLNINAMLDAEELKQVNDLFGRHIARGPLGVWAASDPGDTRVHDRDALR